MRFRPVHALALLIPLALVAGCQNIETADTRSWETEIIEADRLFSAEVAAADPADRATVWAGWFTTDGIQIVPADVIDGHQAVTALMDPFFATAGYQLSWDPDRAEASPDGMMGWTSGRYETRGPDGEVIGEGRYFTLWERQADGSWKVALDTGVPDE